MFAAMVPVVAIVVGSPTAMGAGGCRPAVQGAGFQYESGASIFLDRPTGAPLQSVETDIHGAFETEVAVPANTTPGSHMLVAIGTDGRRAQVAFHVT